MEYQADVVVVGCGAAGAAAAIEAADAGARVRVLEKAVHPGGLSILSAGGVRVARDPAAALRYLRHTCGERTPVDVLAALAQGMAAVPEWLRQLARTDGATIDVKPSLGNYDYPGTESAFAYAEVSAVPGLDPAAGYLSARPFRPGCLLMKLLLDNLDARRPAITLHAGAPARRLLRGADGAILGVTARIDGRDVAVGARRGVVLAAGGFEADEDMKRQYLVSAPVLSASTVDNTGDGIRMAQAAGADLWHMWHCHGPYGFRHPDRPLGLYVKALPMWTPGHSRGPLPTMAWIVVDRHGRRYENEYPPYPSDTGVRQFDRFDPSAGDHPRLPSFMIFDDAGRALYPMGRCITGDPSAHYEWSPDNMREIDNGLLKRAASLPELAARLGVDPAGLVDTVARWNAAIEAGAADPLGRRDETRMPIVRPPFHGAALWPLVINTQGGPVHDARQRVLDPFGQAIPRLYAAGEMGSVFGHVYLAGGNLAECLVGGRTAGREAALAAALPVSEEAWHV